MIVKFTDRTYVTTARVRLNLQAIGANTKEVHTLNNIKRENLKEKRKEIKTEAVIYRHRSRFPPKESSMKLMSIKPKICNIKL